MTPKIGTAVLLCIETHYHPIAAIVTCSLESCEHICVRAIAPTVESDLAAFSVRHGEMGEIETIDSSGQHGKSVGMWLALDES